MRRLVLLRHGTAAPGHGLPDRERPLTEQGRQEAARMGAWLKQQGVRPDRILASPASRALATAQIVVAALGLPASALHPDPSLYSIDPSALLRRLGALQGACVLLVGHNPAFEDVASHLSGDHDLAVRGLPPAGCVVLELPDAWDNPTAGSALSWTMADPSSA